MYIEYYPCLRRKFKDNLEYRQYRFGAKVYNIRKDIINYFDSMNKFEVFLHMIIQEKDALALQYLKKANINNKNEIAMYYGNQILSEEEELQRIKLLFSKPNNKSTMLLSNTINNSNVMMIESNEKNIFEHMDQDIKNCI